MHVQLISIILESVLKGRITRRCVMQPWPIKRYACRVLLVTQYTIYDLSQSYYHGSMIIFSCLLCLPGHMGVLPWKDQFHKLLLEHFAIGDAVRGIHCAEAARSARREQQQLLLLQPQWRSVLLLQPALSASSAASSRSSSSSSGEFLVMPMAAAAAAGDLIRSSGDLSSVISDVSSADLTVDVADWSGSSSSGGVSKDIVTLQQQQQQVLGLA